jgi:hypothetical protein
MDRQYVGIDFAASGDGALHAGHVSALVHLWSRPAVGPGDRRDAAPRLALVAVQDVAASTDDPLARRRPRSWMARGGGHRRWRTEKTAPSGSSITAMRPTSARSNGATDTVPPSWPTRLTISSVSATAK